MFLAIFELFTTLFISSDCNQNSPNSALDMMQTRPSAAAKARDAHFTNAEMLQKIKCWTCGSLIPLTSYFEHLQMKSESERQGYIPCFGTQPVIRASFSMNERSTYEAQLPFGPGPILQAIQQSLRSRGANCDEMGAVKFNFGNSLIRVRGEGFAPHAAQPYSQPLGISFPMTFLGSADFLPLLLVQRIASACSTESSNIKIFAKLGFTQSGRCILKEIAGGGNKDATETVRKMRYQEQTKKSTSGVSLVEASIVIAVNLLPSIPRRLCTICLEDQITNEFSRLPTSRCTHGQDICDAVITENIRANLDSTAWDRIMCPAEGCPEFFQYEDLQVHLNAEDFQR